MPFPGSPHERTASGDRERSPVEEAIFEDLEARHLLNFTSLSSYCFTPAGAQVRAICSCPKLSQFEISRVPCAKPQIHRGGWMRLQWLRSVGLPSGLRFEAAFGMTAFPNVSGRPGCSFFKVVSIYTDSPVLGVSIPEATAGKIKKRLADASMS